MSGLEKLNRMIEEEMEKWEKEHPMTVEQMLACIPDEICDYTVPVEKVYYWVKETCPFCKDKELKADSDEFDFHRKNHL